MNRLRLWLRAKALLFLGIEKSKNAEFDKRIGDVEKSLRKTHGQFGSIKADWLRLDETHTENARIISAEFSQINARIDSIDQDLAKQIKIKARASRAKPKPRSRKSR